MANTPDAAPCLSPAEGGGELLPLSPFYALSYHFGMLLGVGDFETEQAYHRAKMRLHNAWLHREGVVWGFDVQLRLARGEARVLPGLALDAAGRELHLERESCVNVGEWFSAHKDDAGFKVEEQEGGAKRFDAHVVARFKACLTRQVPAMSEPCDGAGGTGTAYSRVFETIELLLLPGPAPARAYPYHLLRLLFALEPAAVKDDAVVAADQEVLNARAGILALPPEEQPAAYLRAFRRFAALDEIDLRPATSEDGTRTSLFPADEQTPLVLANLNGLVVEKQNGKWVLTGGEADVTVRPSHVATSTIQELLCGPLFQAAAAAGAEQEAGPVGEQGVSRGDGGDGPVQGGAGEGAEGSGEGGAGLGEGGAGEGGDDIPSPAPPPGESLPADASGPRVLRDSLELTTTSAKLYFDSELAAATVVPEAFSVTWLDAEGWHYSEVDDALYAPEERSVTIHFSIAVEGRARLVARGTGATPILGYNAVPLAGVAGGPPGGEYDGNDFVHMWELAV